MQGSAIKTRPLVYGHRGARGILPENTLAAFEYAIRAGADGIEMDVAITRDDVPVISHDPHLPGGPLIRELPLAELRRLAPAIPTLSETLALASLRSFLFVIELKSFPDRPQYAPEPPRFAELVLNAIRQERLEHRVLIQSFDFRTLHAMEAVAPEIRRAALFEASNDDFPVIARRARVQTVAPEFNLVTPEKAKMACLAGIEIITWTPNRREEWRKLIEAGVGAIITDDPAGLLAFLSAGA